MFMVLVRLNPFGFMLSAGEVPLGPFLRHIAVSIMPRVLCFYFYYFHFHYGGRKKCATIIRAVKYDTFPPRTLIFQF